jgi:hypothetical protein
MERGDEVAQPGQIDGIEYDMAHSSCDGSVEVRQSTATSIWCCLPAHFALPFGAMMIS